MTNFQLDEFTKRSTQLLERTRGVFDRYADVIKKDAALPATMQPADGPIKLVFVGQYSSGKSSIIKMLSGIDTKIGAAITTDKSKSYPWNNLEIVDTPGIHTGITSGFGSDHDQETYYQIDRAALLIFVVTNEGFDNYIGKHFRKLAIEQDRAKNMVLVVNKMDRTALGNTPEQQKIIADDIVRLGVIAPYTPNQLYLSFLSTEMYFEGQQESDDELKEIYFEQSGREQFVKNLNAFVASRGVLSKVQAPLETLKKSITNVIGDNPIDRSKLDRAEDELDRKMLEISDGSQRFRIEAERIANSCANYIRSQGSDAARSIVAGAEEDEVQRAIDEAKRRTEEHVSECQYALNDQFIRACKDINRELIAIDRSRQSLDLGGRLDIPQNLSTEMQAPPFDPNLIGTTAKQASAMTTGIPFVGDVQLTSVVKGIGHAVGVKFAPWGAANIVKGFSTALGVIGAAYTIYQLGEKIFGTDKEQEMKNKLREARNAVLNSFDNVADETRRNIIEAANAAMEQKLTPSVNKAQAEADNLKRNNERLKALHSELGAIKREVDALMNDVQSTARA